MKRIYLLMTLALGLSTAAQAQRHCDLLFRTYPPAGGLVVTSPDGDPDENDAASVNNTYGFTLINLGPDVMKADDTFNVYVQANVIANNYYIVIPVGAYSPNNTDLAVGDSVALSFNPFAISTINFDEISAETTEELCDTAWLNDVNAVDVDDPDASNNGYCNNVNIHYWALDVKNVANSSFNIYPNPASNVMNLTYNFKGAKNATVIVRDVVGKTVINQNLGSNLNGTQKFTVDISNLANGMYVAELNVDGKKQVRRITVQK